MFTIKTFIYTFISMFIFVSLYLSLEEHHNSSMKIALFLVIINASIIFIKIVILFKPWKIKINKSLYVKDRIVNLKLHPSKLKYHLSTKELKRQISEKFFIDEKIYLYSTSKKQKKALSYETIGDIGEKKYQQENKWAKPQINLKNNNFYGFADFIDKYKIIEVKTTTKRKYQNPKKWLFQLALYMFLSGKLEGLLIVYYINHDEQSHTNKTTPKVKFCIKINSNSIYYKNVIKTNNQINKIKNKRNVYFYPKSLKQWKIAKKHLKTIKLNNK